MLIRFLDSRRNDSKRYGRSSPDGRRSRITVGVTFAIAVLAVMARDFQLIELALGLVAVFFIVWGRWNRETEAFIGRLPCGKCALKFLEQIDLILSPRDREHDQHIRAVISAYNSDIRASLRIVLRTRNSSRVLAHHLAPFTADGLIEYPQNGPGQIKPELRYIVERTLSELGA